MLQAAFIRGNHHTKWFFDGIHLKFKRQMAWDTGAWTTLFELGSLHGKRSEEICQLVLDSSKHSTGLLVFSSGKHDILGKGFTVMESFTDHGLSFVPPSCFTALG